MLIGILLLILAFYLPCRFQSLGCHDIFSYYSKLKHEQHCRFRPYNCPYVGSECSITGDIPALVTHLKDDHNVDMHDGCTFNHRYVKANPHEVENATWMLTNLTKWGGALLELSQFGGINESKKMIGDVVSKLEEALVINPSNHEALWCLGNAYLSHAFLTPDINVAQIDFEKASDSFQRAVDENPGNDLYLKSLEAASEAPELHTELHKHGFAQQAVVGGPSATSSAKNSNGIVLPNKASLYLTTIEDVAEYKEDKIDCELVENNGWKSKI